MGQRSAPKLATHAPLPVGILRRGHPHRAEPSHWIPPPQASHRALHKRCPGHLDRRNHLTKLRRALLRDAPGADRQGSSGEHMACLETGELQSRPAEDDEFRLRELRNQRAVAPCLSGDRPGSLEWQDVPAAQLEDLESATGPECHPAVVPDVP